MVARRSCNTCIYFMKTKKYCLLLNRYVENPNNPPCVKREPSREPKREVSKVVTKPVERPTSIGEVKKSMISEQAKPPEVKVKVPEKNIKNNVENMQDVSVRNVSSSYPTPKVVTDYVNMEGDKMATVVEKAIIERDYASTGIPLLDQILGGGFLRGKTYLVAGETGCGKTIFSMQFLIAGALKGEPGVYIAIDEPTKQLLNGLKKFGWDVSKIVSEGKLLFLDMRTHFSKIYLRDERKKIEPKYIIESILKAAKKIKARRLVIDPIAPLIYGGKSEDVLYAREFLREMVFALERVGELTTVMTSEIPTGSTQLSRFGVEEFLASGIIVLSIQEINGSIERIMYIRKARWAPVKPSKYVFEILPGRGIVIKASLTEYLKSKRENMVY